MKKCLALLLVLVMLLSACGTTQPSNIDPNEETKNTVLDRQNGTTETTTSGETSNTETTGDSSGTGTTDATTESTNSTRSPTEETTKPTDESTVPDDYTLKISQSSLSLEVGQIGNLTVEYTGTGTLVWKTSDSSIATVSNGKVTAKAASSTPVIITVTDGVRSSQCFVTITQKETKPVDVTLNLSKSKLSMKVGETATLSVTYTGSKSLTWTSSNSAAATVSNGKITAKAAGTAYISVSDGVKTATCTVTVTNPTKPVEVKLTVSPTTLNLVVGNTSTLTASYNGTGTLSWSSDKPSVVTVSNGKVTAKAAGTATITVTDGNKSATCKITVTAPVTTTLEINTKSDTTITVGSTLQIDYTYSGNKSELTWTSSDTSVLTVNSNGVVTGVAAGRTTVKVTNGEMTARVKIIVDDAKPLATSLEMNGFNAPLYDGVVKYAGDYMNLRVWTLPYESNRDITVTSSNNSVVSVSWQKDSSNKNNITLNFKSAGFATVTIASADGAVSKSYSITVKGGYNSPHGYGQLTPEQWADCCNAVVAAHDFTITDCSSYKWLTLSDAELTWANAVWHGEQFVRAWWPDGYRTVNITYMGVDENGNHLFYTYH